MNSTAFDSMRLIAVISVVLLKLALMPVYLQSYLDLANQRLEIQKKEAGKISNKDLQKKIAAVFYYLCVVSLQYIAPLLMCFYFTLMYKTLGGYTWGGLFKEYDYRNISKVESPLLISDNGEKTVAQSAQELQLAIISLKQIFTVQVFRGILGFTTWWCCFTLFATTSMGMVYQSYFSNI